MKTIYISPHLDDAVYSCGGWIWEQTQQGAEVEIWTICAGDPPPGTLSSFARFLHHSWGLSEQPVQVRQEEDRKACQMLGAVPRHFPFLDCIYRLSPLGEAYYQAGEEIFGGLDPREVDLIDEVAAALEQVLPREADLIVPLGIGNHVDHELTRKAVSRLGRSLLYYADYPYARSPEGREILSIMEASREWHGNREQITEKGLDRWWKAAQAYGSQLSTFWEDADAMQREISDFSAYLGGMRLWQAQEEQG